MPVPKPPFPAQHGLWGKPTVINNVETLANIPVILTKGGAWLAAIGTENPREPRFSPSRVKSTIPGSWKYRWAPPFGRLSSTLAAASGTAKSSRAYRPADLPEES